MLDITLSIIDSTSVFGKHKIGVLWSGGKQSTILWTLVSTAMDAEPIFIDHGLHPQETHQYLHLMYRKGNFNVQIFRNDDVLKTIEGGKVRLADGVHDYTMKDPLVYRELFIKPYRLALSKYELVFAGNRWNRRPEDAYLKYFMKEGETIVVRPLLHWKESEVWKYIIENNLEVNERYRKGYRSVDYAYDQTAFDKPAWEQKLDDGNEEPMTKERAEMVKKLKELGYL